MLSTRDKIKAVQSEVGAYPDGFAGPQTYDCIYRQFAKPKLPYAVKLFNQWTFFADPKEVNPFAPKGKSVRQFKNCISGSFSHKMNPISILISKGEVIRGLSCHQWEVRDGESYFPESVLWYNSNGEYGITQTNDVNKLPDRKNIVWAIGGAGLNKGDAFKEYFSGKFRDIWRTTSHIVIGFDNSGYFTAIEVQRMNGTQIKSLIKKVGLTHAILLDGGHVTASNVDGHKYNSYQGQYYAIQLGG